MHLYAATLTTLTLSTFPYSVQKTCTQKLVSTHRHIAYSAYSAFVTSMVNIWGSVTLITLVVIHGGFVGATLRHHSFTQCHHVYPSAFTQDEEEKADDDHHWSSDFCHSSTVAEVH